jgi:hypothetical protein
MSEPRPLYELPGLPKDSLVVVCEGEKAADAARSLGFTATTSAGGSNAAAKTDWSPLAGKEIWVIPDNDTPGRKYADAVVGILSRLKPKPVVKVLNLPGLPEHGDIVDWIDAHGDAADPETLRAEVEELSRTTLVEDSPILTCMADVTPQEVRWLWPHRIPLGRLTLLVGRPGEGKSFLTMALAAHVSTGRKFPDMSLCPSGSAIIISAEDDPADTIRPRLDASEADVNRVFVLSRGDVHAEGRQAGRTILHFGRCASPRSRIAGAPRL